MRLRSYEFSDECLHLEFDEQFNEIKIQKLEPIEGEIRDLDHLKMSLNFSKPKSGIDLQVQKLSSYAIVIVNEQAYYLTRQQMNGLDLIGRGMVTLFKEVIPQQNCKIGFGLDQLKNENISAEVKRRWS
jgi:hypothetical protein